MGKVAGNCDSKPPAPLLAAITKLRGSRGEPEPTTRGAEQKKRLQTVPREYNFGRESLIQRLVKAENRDGEQAETQARHGCHLRP